MTTNSNSNPNNSNQKSSNPNNSNTAANHATSPKVKQINCPACKTLCAWNDNPYRPFCSSRCKDGDFIAWATQSYTLGEATQDEESPFSGELPS